AVDALAALLGARRTRARRALARGWRRSGYRCCAAGHRRRAEVGERHQEEDHEDRDAEADRDVEPLARAFRPLVARDDVLESTHVVHCNKRIATALVARDWQSPLPYAA